MYLVDADVHWGSMWNAPLTPLWQYTWRVGGQCRARDCSDLDCGLHGRCQDGFCACAVGFYGERCHLSSSCPGVLQPNGTCCYSGMLSTRDAHDRLSFGCCPPGSSLDARGACCDGIVDGSVPPLLLVAK